jgi:hypothetical protein
MCGARGGKYYTVYQILGGPVERYTDTPLAAQVRVNLFLDE